MKANAINNTSKVTISSQKASPTRKTPPQRGCFPSSLPFPSYPFSRSTIKNSSSKEEPIKEESIINHLTPENVAQAYDSTRTFFHLLDTQKNTVSQLLHALKSNYATPFLTVINDYVLFSTEESQFHRVKISEIPLDLTPEKLPNLGSILDESIKQKILSKLQNEIQGVHHMDIDGAGSIQINVYPNQSTISQEKMLIITFSNQSSDSSQFSSSLKQELTQLGFPSISEKPIESKKTLVFTIPLNGDKDDDFLLDSILTNVVAIKNVNTGINIDDIKMFSTSFHEILNPTKHASKEALFNQIDSIDPLDPSISQYRADNSYPYAVLLETGLATTDLNIPQDSSTIKMLSMSKSTLILFQKKEDAPSIIDIVQKQAVKLNFKYSMYIEI